MSILIGLAHEPVLNAAVATQIVFQQPAKASMDSSAQYRHLAGLFFVTTPKVRMPFWQLNLWRLLKISIRRAKNAP
ncbi:hypothetical protein QDX81_05670 [Pseudomonas sp. CW003PS]|jgi:hypothetical protein|nr:hypothetical protein QDX81_05670 [Pseudomonas sp. CW003PS]